MKLNETSSDVMQNSLIMMVDDEPIMIDLIQMFLSDYGYKRFEGISDSTKALQAIFDTQPDVLLLDLIMPGINGYELLKQLRESPKTKHLPIIILTSSTNNETMLKALELGATDFLAKPVDQSELALRLRNTLTFKAYQDRLKYYDELTGLPNIRKFSERLDIVSETNKNNIFAVLVVNIIKLDEFTEAYGSSFRDEVIKYVGSMLVESVRDSDTVSREESYLTLTAHIKSDKFSVLLNRVTSNAEIGFVCERIQKLFSYSHVLMQREVFIDIGIGISIYPEDGKSSGDLIYKAENAAKTANKNPSYKYNFYSVDANNQLRRSVHLRQELRKAIEKGQLYLFYQPQVSNHSKQVIGAEALVRWIHPEMGDISPVEFIPIAESAGLMIELGNLVFKIACEQSVTWNAKGLKDITISVNASVQQFLSPDYISALENIITDTGVNPKNIVIEVTESMSMSDPNLTIDILHKLRKLDIKVSIDDFGTGYSSLNYLRVFPINEIKIDKTFVDGLPHNKGDVAIVAAIITLAKVLGFTTVAEGIENEEQLTHLEVAGCDFIQGYYYSKPIDSKAFITFVDKLKLGF